MHLKNKKNKSDSGKKAILLSKFQQNIPTCMKFDMSMVILMYCQPVLVILVTISNLTWAAIALVRVTKLLHFECCEWSDKGVLYSYILKEKNIFSIGAKRLETKFFKLENEWSVIHPLFSWFK